MPTRLIREGIITSDRVEQLDYPSEVFYRRLMNKVDDHGLHDARPTVLRAALYPLRIDRVREADITRWLAACQTAGLLALYDAGGKPYLKVLDTRWQVRSAPKCPVPTDEQLKTPVNGCVPSRSRLSKSESLVSTGAPAPTNPKPPDPNETRIKTFMQHLARKLSKCTGAAQPRAVRQVYGLVIAYLKDHPDEIEAVSDDIDRLPVTHDTGTAPTVEWYVRAIGGVMSARRHAHEKATGRQPLAESLRGLTATIGKPA